MTAGRLTQRILARLRESGAEGGPLTTSVDLAEFLSEEQVVIEAALRWLSSQGQLRMEEQGLNGHLVVVECLNRTTPEGPGTLHVHQHVARDAMTQIGNHNAFHLHLGSQHSQPDAALQMRNATAAQTALHGRLQTLLSWHSLDQVRAAQLLEPYGFSVADLTDPVRTVARYDERLLEFLMGYFQVGRAFLLAESELPAMPVHDYYKQVRHLCQRVVDLHNAGDLSHVFVFRRLPSRRETLLRRFVPEAVDDHLVLLALQRNVGGAELYTFELWQPVSWAYAPSRLDLKSFLLFCEVSVTAGQSIWVNGGTFEAEKFGALASGQLHAAQLIREGFYGRGQKWHPTDCVSLTPHLLTGKEELPEVVARYRAYGLDQLLASLQRPPGTASEAS